MGLVHFCDGAPMMKIYKISDSVKMYVVNYSVVKVTHYISQNVARLEEMKMVSRT